MNTDFDDISVEDGSSEDKTHSSCGIGRQSSNSHASMTFSNKMKLDKRSFKFKMNHDPLYGVLPTVTIKNSHPRKQRKIDYDAARESLNKIEPSITNFDSKLNNAGTINCPSKSKHESQKNKLEFLERTSLKNSTFKPKSQTKNDLIASIAKLLCPQNNAYNLPKSSKAFFFSKSSTSNNSTIFLTSSNQTLGTFVSSCSCNCSVELPFVHNTEENLQKERAIVSLGDFYALRTQLATKKLFADESPMLATPAPRQKSNTPIQNKNRAPVLLEASLNYKTVSNISCETPSIFNNNKIDKQKCYTSTLTTICSCVHQSDGACKSSSLRELAYNSYQKHDQQSSKGRNWFRDAWKTLKEFWISILNSLAMKLN